MLLNLSILLALLLVLIYTISKWKIHPFIALILTAMALGIALGMGGTKTVEVLLEGFSNTLKWIAVIIILGAFIGEVLQETGGAYRIANSIVGGVRKGQLPWAMGITGYLVSIPVFVDVAYILLQPVTESLSVKSKTPVLYLGLALTAGLTVAHTLIPPTPGPMAMASLMNLDMGRMLMIHLVVGLFAMGGGVLFVTFFVKDAWLAYDQKLKTSIKNKAIDAGHQDEQSGDLFWDLLPILLPIVLIGVGAFIEFDDSSLIGSIGSFLSIPLVAVLVGAFMATIQLTKKDRRNTINRLVEQAILKSALVIMITGAGGSLGFVIKQSGVQNEILDVFSDLPFLGMLLPFLVASVLATATGSITVSLVGTASMLGPMVESLPVSPEIAAAFVGSGAFCVFHANSSFFWLLNRLHDAPPKILYKTFTLQSLVMGISGLLGVLFLRIFGF